MNRAIADDDWPTLQIIGRRLHPRSRAPSNPVYLQWVKNLRDKLEKQIQAEQYDQAWRTTNALDLLAATATADSANLPFQKLESAWKEKCAAIDRANAQLDEAQQAILVQNQKVQAIQQKAEFLNWAHEHQKKIVEIRWSIYPEQYSPYIEQIDQAMENAEQKFAALQKDPNYRSWVKWMEAAKENLQALQKLQAAAPVEVPTAAASEKIEQGSQGPFKKWLIPIGIFFLLVSVCCLGIVGLGMKMGTSGIQAILNIPKTPIVTTALPPTQVVSVSASPIAPVAQASPTAAAQEPVAAAPETSTPSASPTPPQTPTPTTAPPNISFELAPDLVGMPPDGLYDLPPLKLNLDGKTAQRSNTYLEIQSPEGVSWLVGITVDSDAFPAGNTVDNPILDPQTAHEITLRLIHGDQIVSPYSQKYTFKANIYRTKLSEIPDNGPQNRLSCITSSLDVIEVVGQYTEGNVTWLKIRQPNTHNYGWVRNEKQYLGSPIAPNNLETIPIITNLPTLNWDTIAQLNGLSVLELFCQ